MGNKKANAGFDENDPQKPEVQEGKVKKHPQPTSSVEKLLYSKKDAAYALSMSPRSVDYLIAGKKLQTRRIGSRVLIPAESIRRFARSDHFESVAS